MQPSVEWRRALHDDGPGADSMAPAPWTFVTAALRPFATATDLPAELVPLAIFDR